MVQNLAMSNNTDLHCGLMQLFVELCWITHLGQTCAVGGTDVLQAGHCLCGCPQWLQNGEEGVGRGV